MSIPKTRKQLLEQLIPAWEKLDDELRKAGPDIAGLHCVDEWSVKDLLAVRVWWTGAVIDWIESWRRGEGPALPKEGYDWTETPRLNSEIVKLSRGDSFDSTVKKLQANYERIIGTINKLSDSELADVGHFKHAGKYPVCRWISINSTRQYLTARTLIRKAIRKNAGG